MQSRVVIVGAGPGGSAAAIRLAQRGVTDVVLLDKDKFPRDKTCGSALSPSALTVLRELQVIDDVKRLAHGIRGMVLTTRGNRKMRIESGEVAVVLLRRDFDHLLVERAKAGGVRFLDAFRVTELQRDNGRVTGVRGLGGDIAAECVICADGAYSLFSTDRRPKQTISTIMGWWEDFAFEPGVIEMIFDRSLAPLYGWMFPETAERVNIGICIDTRPPGDPRRPQSLRDLFQAFLDRHFSQRLKTARQIGNWKGHPISYTTWIRNCASPGVLYLGEAARLTHHLTGEGIYQAMQSGIFAADAVADLLVGKVPEAEAHQQYLRRVRKAFFASFTRGHLFRFLLKTPLLDGIAALYNHPRFRQAAGWAVGSALAGSDIPSKAAAMQNEK